MLLVVKEKRLNKRTSIPTRFGDKSSVIGQVIQGFRFDGEEVAPADIPNPSLGNWFRDRDGYFYWGGGVEKEFIQELVEIQEEIPWWMNKLEIPHIWSTYNEKGINAKIAVIDSGFNDNNNEIKDGIVGTYVHPSIAGISTINDTLGHGSYCASIIGARNRNFVVGCAPQCQLYISKVTISGAYSNKRVEDAIVDAVNNHVDIISLSIGGDISESLRTLIKETTTANNILIVAAIGNNQHSEQPQQGGLYPALFEQSIAVGATTKSSNISIVTLLNEKTEIYAPGEDILAYTLHDTPDKLNTGTSQATAIVAGICALIISRYKSLGKNYNVQEIKNLIIRNSIPINNNPNTKLISPKNIFLHIPI